MRPTGSVDYCGGLDDGNLLRLTVDVLERG